MTFNTLGLSDTLLQAVQQTGYTTPTPIQQKAIPEILNGRDVMAAAQTGTGKTAGFTLPLLQLLSGRANRTRNSFRALILTPTRELAAQIEDSIQTYGSNENLRYGVVFGGVNINPQKKTLNRGLDILVATPGRLLDLYQQKCIDFRDIEVLILDEIYPRYQENNRAAPQATTEPDVLGDVLGRHPYAGEDDLQQPGGDRRGAKKFYGRSDLSDDVSRREV